MRIGYAQKNSGEAAKRAPAREGKPGKGNVAASSQTGMGPERSTYPMALSAIGFACYILCGIVEFNPSLYPQPNAEALQLLDVLNPLRWAVNIASITAFALLSKRFGSLYGRKTLVIGLGVAYATSIGLLLACGYGRAFVPAGVVVGCLLQSASVGFIVLWGELFCTLDSRKVVVIAAVGYALAFSGAALIAGMQPPMMAALLIALPLLSAAVLSLFGSEAKERPAPRESRALKELPLKPFLAIGIFGFAQLLVVGISEQRVTYSTELFSVIGGAMAAAVVVVALRIARGRFDLVMLYRFVTPALVLAMLGVLVAETGAQEYEAYGLGACYGVFRIFTIALWCNLAMNSTLPSGFVIGIAQVVLTLCDKVETPVAHAINQLDVSQSITVALVIAAVVVASTFLLNERDFLRPQKAQATIAFSSLEEFYEECVAHAAEAHGLTQREQDICRMVLRGRSSDEIREQLFIAPGTFKTHMRNIYGKLSVHSRQELVTKLRNETQAGAEGEC